MAKDIVKIGIVGLGLGQWQVETFENLEHVQVVAVADNAAKLDNGQTPKEFADAHGFNYFDDGIRMIETEELDAVSLCVSPKFREPLLAAAAAKGLPVFMEKPLATNLEQGKRLRKIVQDSGILFMMEFPLRFMPPLRELRRMLDDGTLGKPYMINGDLMMSWYPQDNHWLWNPENGNGVNNEAICHLYDTILFLGGKPVTVYAQGGNFAGKHDLDDRAALLITFENGAVATLNGGAHGAPAMDTKTWVNVAAEKGQAIVTGQSFMFENITWAKTADTETQTSSWPIPPRKQIMRYSAMHFIDCVRNNKRPECGIEDGYLVQLVVDAMKRSIATGQPVKIEY